MIADFGIQGQGTLSVSKGSVEVKGNGSKFTAQCKIGDLLWVKGISKDGEGFKITEIKVLPCCSRF